MYKVIRNRSIWGPCQFLMLAPNTLWNFYLSICLETWNNLYERNLEKWTCEGCLKKNEKLYGKILNLTEQVKEFPWKNDEFAWTSERIYMVQRYSKYRFFDVNCILKYSKYRFSSSIPGMPGETKISIPYSMWVEDLICIYIYVYVCVL